MKRSILKTIATLLISSSILLFGAGNLFAATDISDYTINLQYEGSSFFPDAVLLQYVSETFDTNHDNKLTPAERNAVTTFDISWDNDTITTVQGVTLFPNLTTVDFSNHTQCASSIHSYFDKASNPTSVKSIKINNCNLSEFPSDFSRFVNLEVFECAGNRFRHVNIMNHSKLLSACMNDSRPSTVDGVTTYSVTASRNVVYTFKCNSTLHIEVDLASNYFPNNSNLYMNILFAWNYVGFDYDYVTLAFLNQMHSTTSLTINDDIYTIHNLNGISNFTNLQTLVVNEKVSTIDVSSISTLTSLTCANNSNLTTITLGDNHLTTLDCSNCPSLTSIDLTNQTSLNILKCQNTGITSIDLSGLNDLSYCDISGNSISSVDLTNNATLCSLVDTVSPSTSDSIVTYSNTSVRPSRTLIISSSTELILPVVNQGWIKENNLWSYYVDGVKTTGWMKIDGTWYYFGEDGVMKTSWQQIDGIWYYFRSSGSMVTGWSQINGNWYYFRNSGSMVTGWSQISGNWYYFRSSGSMVTGWSKIDNVWYYFRSSGAMATGWNKIDNVWYYFTSSGSMVTGWQKIDGKYYYFYSSGAMAIDTWIGNYYVNASGVWTTSR